MKILQSTSAQLFRNFWLRLFVFVCFQISFCPFFCLLNEIRTFSWFSISKLCIYANCELKLYNQFYANSNERTKSLNFARNMFVVFFEFFFCLQKKGGNRKTEEKQVGKARSSISHTRSETNTVPHTFSRNPNKKCKNRKTIKKNKGKRICFNTLAHKLLRIKAYFVQSQTFC